jgi:hypothetical protein
LPPDRSTATAITLGERQVEQLEAEVDQAANARDRAGARRRLNVAIEALEVARIEAELQRKEETAMWRQIWRTPQAVEWERLHWTREVALYVRHKVKAEGGTLAHATEARHLSDRLGLTPMALARLRWAISTDASASSAPRLRSKRAGRYSDLRVVGP